MRVCVCVYVHIELSMNNSILIKKKVDIIS